MRQPLSGPASTGLLCDTVLLVYYTIVVHMRVGVISLSGCHSRGCFTLSMNECIPSIGVARVSVLPA
jgi:hypothetical protein